MDSYKTFEPHLKNKLKPVINSEKDNMIGFCEKGLSVFDYWFLTSHGVRNFVDREMEALEKPDLQMIVDNVKEIPDDSWIKECYSGEELLERLARQALSAYSTTYLIEMSYPMLKERELQLEQQLLRSDLIEHKTSAELRLIEEEKRSLSGVEYQALEAVQNFIDVENMNEQELNFAISEKLRRIRSVISENNNQSSTLY